MDISDIRQETKSIHVALNGLKKRLQPFVRSGIRKISDEDLHEGKDEGGSAGKRGELVTLKEGASSVCAAGGTPCSVTGAAGASDIFIELEAGLD
jgi:hypothetical protein